MCDEPFSPRPLGGFGKVACGRCRGCRLEYARQWAVRCMHEAAMHAENCFVTLTYKDAPRDLHYPHFQAFMRRLRKRVSNVSFYMCGEYGPKNGRPHFHALLFGVGFRDKVSLGKSPSGSQLYSSAVLSELWGHGFASVGEVTFESAGYCARYVYKKMTDGSVYTGAVGEFSRMSLRPAVGKRWFDRYGRSDVLSQGKVISGGVEATPPRYYRRELVKRYPLSVRVVSDRAEDAARAGLEKSADGANRRIAAEVAIRDAAMKNVHSKETL